MATSYTVLIDDREKKPLTLPNFISVLANPLCPTHSSSSMVRIYTRKARLPTADYILGDEEGVFYTGPAGCILERKLSIDELHNNLFNAEPRARFIDALNRMKAWRFPVLLLEASHARFFKPTPRVKNPGHVHDALIALLLDTGVHLHYLPLSATSRSELGEWAARALIVGDRCGSREAQCAIPGSP